MFSLWLGANSVLVAALTALVLLLAACSKKAPEPAPPPLAATPRYPGEFGGCYSQFDATWRGTFTREGRTWASSQTGNPSAQTLFVQSFDVAVTVECASVDKCGSDDRVYVLANQGADVPLFGLGTVALRVLDLTASHPDFGCPGTCKPGPSALGVGPDGVPFTTSYVNTGYADLELIFPSGATLKAYGKFSRDWRQIVGSSATGVPVWEEAWRVDCPTCPQSFLAPCPDGGCEFAVDRVSFALTKQ